MFYYYWEGLGRVKIDILKRPIILEAFYDRAAVIGTNWDCRFSINLLAAVVVLGQFILGLIHKLRHNTWSFKRRSYLNLIWRRALFLLYSKLSNTTIRKTTTDYIYIKNDPGLRRKALLSWALNSPTLFLFIFFILYFILWFLKL